MKTKELDPKAEAYRYIDNAKTILKEKTTIENNRYSDSKYVRIAGHTAWSGVLIALKAWAESKGIKSKGRPNYEFYRNLIAKHDKKTFGELESAYNILHLFLGYDGERKVNISKEGFSSAQVVIDKLLK